MSNRSEVEIIKENSNYLRGTIKESLANELTGAISPVDTNLIKFHGSYQQFDRELDSERRKQKLEPLYSFMIRVRLVGGIVTPSQWLVIDELADKYGTGTIKLTTRQAFQLHGVFKKDLKSTIQEINHGLMDTISACGDVNRNVMCNPNPFQSIFNAQAIDIAQQLSAHLTPKSTGYHEIWLDKQLVAGGETNEEPIYGKTYLPRKFKIAIAIPPNNDVDIFANDLGLIAIVEDGKLVGFNVAVGGGMGMTFGNNETYPRLAAVIGFCPVDQIVDVAEKVLITQRDLGNRADRRYARLKYTIDRIGIDQFKSEFHQRLGYELQPEKPYQFTSNGDLFGWQQSPDGNWHLTLFIEGGRVSDSVRTPSKTALREIAQIHQGDFRLTGNQNLIITNISENEKPVIERILSKYNLIPKKNFTGLRLNSMACVALNTCSLAFAEAERYLPSLIDRLDLILEELHLQEEPIVVRMTGCPNGCGRPYLGEIGFVGKAPGQYNLYLGAGFSGDRLNKLYRENLNEEQLIDALKPILIDFSKNREANERFGDFVIRKNYVKATSEGKNFHEL